jgi:hypothetical protein
MGVPMYCPICSQQQVSEEMRFCSRCGFPLEGLKELVAAGGVLAKPDIDSLTNKHSKLLCALRQSVWLMAAAFLGLLVVGALAALEDELAVLVLLPIICFLFAFIRLIYITVKESKRRKREAEAATLPQQNATRTTQLPPQRVAPIENFTAHPTQTAEMIRPPSVTENTTRLLDET